MVIDNPISCLDQTAVLYKLHSDMYITYYRNLDLACNVVDISWTEDTIDDMREVSD
jgi:hypothetical protein